MPANNHLVVVPVSSRSHIRLFLQLTLNLLALHPSLVATMLVSSVSYPIVLKEIDLQPQRIMDSLEGRFRVKRATDGLESTASRPDEQQAFERCISSDLGDLFAEKAEGRFVTKPCLVINDLFRAFVRDAVRQKTDELGISTVPVIQFLPTMALIMHRYLQGGWAEHMVERYLENKAAGMEENAAARKAFRGIQNQLQEWPDLPPMYDYEFSEFSRPKQTPARLLLASVKANIVPELDAASLKAMSRVRGSPVIGVGPQFNADVWNAAEEEEKSAKAQEDEKRIMSFLDAALGKYGTNSSAYISFGTVFWPEERPELVTAIIESLLELTEPIPFILATATANGKADPALKKRIEASGRGLIVDWAPQVRVLRHDAVGMFLTHCGFNSLTEAIMTGVPIITMPFAADQPALSAHFTQIRKMGIQLYQLSSGNDGQTLGNGVHVNSTPEAMQEELRTTWIQMRGPQGEEFRKNTIRVRGLMRKSYEEGGTREAMLSLSQYFTDKE
ncbi:MAG: hypothetical protein TREMPRED_002646 [Tremellales sp. Tagirdzhanova-0007]|nr:MAG: hypothetical protein TREMPRED_002646 [Tremellales sp. Tagirdzhanova-0007]